LPPEWLNPSASAETVEYESIGQYSGTYEERKASTGA